MTIRRFAEIFAISVLLALTACGGSAKKPAEVASPGGVWDRMSWDQKNWQ